MSKEKDGYSVIISTKNIGESTIGVSMVPQYFRKERKFTRISSCFYLKRTRCETRFKANMSAVFGSLWVTPVIQEL
ncbi:unnamed protein product [Caenorhabditis auriculariae]|uniref:Uncharacterized protein n=1 Tax=Caenorhabditis auriculariae TaxID=2777116 RepID=A0A8S1GSS7_9PELO|nr:unnamed protein product [Caenorhabditis auriculariae]